MFKRTITDDGTIATGHTRIRVTYSFLGIPLYSANKLTIPLF